MTTSPQTTTAYSEIELACRTMLAVEPAVMRSITVLLAAPQADAISPCEVTRMAEQFGLEAFVSFRSGCMRVRLVRRVRLRHPL